MKAFHEVLGFQLQLDGCQHEIMIVAIVGTLERPCVCFAHAGVEALGCQDEVYLVVNLPMRGMPRCCPGQHVGVDSVCNGESVALCKL